LVKALHLIRQKRGVEIPAVFVGFPREAFGAVMALVAKLGLGQQVFYLGYVTEKEIVALYRKAVAMVIPTLFELHSLPIVEALALETCCVASNSFSLPEQAEDAALLIDAQDPQDIADKIWRVWTDPTLRRELTSRGKRLVEEKYSRQAFVKQWLEVISDAAEICRSPARL
jgi:glycosyltransferase involved in cell wall biosynthesis